MADAGPNMVRLFKVSFKYSLAPDITEENVLKGDLSRKAEICPCG